MEVPNALATPIAPFANSGESLIAQVIGGAHEVNGIPLQYSPAPAVEPHLLDRDALMLTCPFPRIGEQLLESPSKKESVRGREFPDAEYEAALWSGRSPRQPG